MIQNEEDFYGDVKLVLVSSFLTRLMIRNLRQSPVGIAHFEHLRMLVFRWFSQLRDREIALAAVSPSVQEYYDKLLATPLDGVDDTIASIAELTRFVLEHPEREIEQTINCITSKHYFKTILKRSWDDRDKYPDFESWYAHYFES